MNERIKELAKQAGFDVKRLVEPYPGGFPREDFLALESFAELIVRECADLYDRFQARDVGMQPAECAGAIRNMFGVE